MMNQNALIIEWDDSKPKEIEEAKTKYREAREEGRVVTLHNGEIAEVFRPYYKCIIIKESEMSETQFSARFHDETGDRRLIWDANSPEEIEEAADLFREYLGKGWRAYTVNRHGRRGKRIYGFNQDTLEIFFDESSVKDSLKKFAESITKDIKTKTVQSIAEKKSALKKFVETMKSTKVIPRTYPG